LNDKWIAISGKKIIDYAESQFNLTKQLLENKKENKDVYIVYMTEKEEKPIFIGVSWDLTSNHRISTLSGQRFFSIISPDNKFSRNTSATVDTGANISTISEAVAEFIELEYFSVQKVFGIGGPCLKKQYSVSFSFTFETNPTIIGVFNSNAILFHKTLIGMDILNKMNFNYSMNLPRFEMNYLPTDYDWLTK